MTEFSHNSDQLPPQQQAGIVDPTLIASTARTYEDLKADPTVQELSTPTGEALELNDIADTPPLATQETGNGRTLAMLFSIDAAGERYQVWTGQESDGRNYDKKVIVTHEDFDATVSESDSRSWNVVLDVDQPAKMHVPTGNPNQFVGFGLDAYGLQIETAREQPSATVLRKVGAESDTLLEAEKPAEQPVETAVAVPETAEDLEHKFTMTRDQIRQLEDFSSTLRSIALNGAGYESAEQSQASIENYIQGVMSQLYSNADSLQLAAAAESLGATRLQGMGTELLGLIERNPLLGREDVQVLYGLANNGFAYGQRHGFNDIQFAQRLGEEVGQNVEYADRAERNLGQDKTALKVALLAYGAGATLAQPQFGVAEQLIQHVSKSSNL